MERSVQMDSAVVNIFIIMADIEGTLNLQVNVRWDVWIDDYIIFFFLLFTEKVSIAEIEWSSLYFRGICMFQVSQNDTVIS